MPAFCPLGLATTARKKVKKQQQKTQLTQPMAKLLQYIIPWVVPLPSNSDHQDCFMFSRESL